jgi:hypothetical protein
LLVELGVGLLQRRLVRKVLREAKEKWEMGANMEAGEVWDL